MRRDPPWTVARLIAAEPLVMGPNKYPNGPRGVSEHLSVQTQSVRLDRSSGPPRSDRADDDTTFCDPIPVLRILQ
jgi:hypothetical protein